MDPHWEPWFSGGGGVVRDSSGNILIGFAVFFGTKTNMEAEFLALLEEVQLCMEQGLHCIQVEMHSKALQLMMLGNCQVPWKLWKEVSQIKALTQGNNFNFSYMFWEANVVANALANLASSTLCYKRFTPAQVSQQVLGLAALDRIHTPYIRMI